MSAIPITEEQVRRFEEIQARKRADEEVEYEEIGPAISRLDTKPEMDPSAYHGLAGTVVRAIAPTTEADPVAVLATFLIMYGNAVGRGPHMMIGEARHGTNLFGVLVGDTSRGRKGESKKALGRLFGEADQAWLLDRVMGGLSSGEGLIEVVRDHAVSAKGETIAEGVDDKRVLLIEEEMSQVLKTAQRQGATISEIIRRAWDSPEVLRTITKTSPSKASGAHISILAHITKAELKKHITETELANGLANRFAWFRVHRSRLIPDPQPLPLDVVNDLGGRIGDAIAFARKAGRVCRDQEATDLWEVAYRGLEQEQPGLSGAITARSSPIVCRLSLIYALLDHSPVIRTPHLEAAVAVWDYAQKSVESVFGDMTGDDVADRIIDVLTTEGQQSLTQLHQAFGRNVPGPRIAQALTMLLQAGKIRAFKERRQGAGRRSTVYRLAESEGDS